ncbi:MAG TPA: HD domain-containing protein [Gemmatimonadales bacterium]|nr:HD domain-containing protein [Gemmatimonadales bacterium]
MSRDGLGAREVVVRDLLWQNIVLEPAAALVVDTPTFQRLRYVRQLGHAFLVYPGATHTRFEHALGAYALARRALAGLGDRGALRALEPPERLLIRLAALLHDVGHYPFSHAIEELGLTSHETLAAGLLSDEPLAQALAATGIADAPSRISALIRGGSDHPLAGLISGSIDLDKIDYLKRDALMCGVPYGEVDVDRLLACLTLADVGGRPCIAMLEKGIAALESLLFAKYQMYRNVYWHHAVRSATAMFKRLIHEAVTDGLLEPGSLVEETDDALMHRLRASDRTGLAAALAERRLYKRALELLPSELPVGIPAWLRDTSRRSRAEDTLAKRVGLGPAELLIDLPVKEAMLGLDLPIVRSDGSVENLTQDGWPGRMDLPPFAKRLADSACRLRVFVRRAVKVPLEDLADVLAA